MILRICSVVIIISSLFVLWSRTWSVQNSLREGDVVVELKHSDVFGEPEIHADGQQFPDVISFEQGHQVAGKRIVIKADANVFHEQIDRIVAVLKKNSPDSEFVLARTSSFAE